ncbi:hypothetical protein JHL18_13600 [Clostridium sp. YIM B02505]|uniref:Transposase n=1 Tax=Clostridium yunnanense TaxID=2800325 RepID=A0ABS1EQS7_9CLOT|nr:hypothetical protein [Clostridium yunnanense]MBK1811653.1 hypothetical protein [Clostridium yunnanense]
MSSNDKRGKAGAVALKKSAAEKIQKNKKILIRELDYFRKMKIPLVKTELSKQSGISIATLNRSPYKEIIKEYLEEEKTLLSPNGRQELSQLIQENKQLKEEIEFWKEKYKRLKKEIVFVKELI